MVCVVILGLAVQSAWAGGTGRCGGTGGSNQKTLTCPSGQYVVGLQGRGGTYVDLVGIACAPIGADGKRGTIGTFMSAGPGGGTNTGSGICPGRDAVRAIRGNSGIWYDYLGDGACSGRVASTGRFEDRDATTAPVKVGGSGGSQCRVGCPTGEALYSITVKYGSWIDSISGQCRP